MKTWTKDEVDALLKPYDDRDVLTDDPYGRDRGQLVIYTGIFLWVDGSYHDEEEPNSAVDDDEEETRL